MCAADTGTAEDLIPNELNSSVCCGQKCSKQFGLGCVSAGLKGDPPDHGVEAIPCIDRCPTDAPVTQRTFTKINLVVDYNGNVSSNMKI